MEAADKIARVHQYVEAFDKADINLIKDMYADNATVEDPVGSDPYQGIEAIVAFYEGAFDMGAKLSLNEAPRCAGNSVAFSFTVKVGDMTIQPIDVFEFNDEGKVVSMKAYWGPENTQQ
jgi:steroid delta-isomerase